MMSPDQREALNDAIRIVQRDNPIPAPPEEAVADKGADGSEARER
ncbi:hypothetical protein SNARM312S_03466 [Streptomyces narbonensis]